jgi:hypothetical protein
MSRVSEENILSLMTKEADDANSDNDSNAPTESAYALLSLETSTKYFHDYASAVDNFDIAIIRNIPYFGFVNLVDLTIILPTIQILRYIPPRVETLTLVKVLFEPKEFDEVYPNINNISVLASPYFNFSLFPNASVIRAIAIDTVIFDESHPNVNYLKLIIGCNIDLHPFANVSNVVISALYTNIFVHNASKISAEIIAGLSVIFDNEYMIHYLEKRSFLSNDDEYMDDWTDYHLTNYKPDSFNEFDKKNNNIGDLFYFIITDGKYTIDYLRLMDENNDEEDVNKTLVDFII